MRGEELPDGLSLPDQMAYTALRNTYRAYYDKIISRDAAAAEKQRIRLAWERAVSRAAFDQRLTTYHVKVIRETEAAKNAATGDAKQELTKLAEKLDALRGDKSRKNAQLEKVVDVTVALVKTEGNEIKTVAQLIELPHSVTVTIPITLSLIHI